MRYLHFTPEFGLWYSSFFVLSLCGYYDADFAGYRLITSPLLGLDSFWDLHWFLCLLANSLVYPNPLHRLSILLLLATARDCYG
jgi:hypothetical protein